MSTFETLLHPAMDLTEMRQLGNIKTRRVQVIPESGTSYTLSGTATQDVFFSLPAGSKYDMINGMNSYVVFDLVPTITGGSSPVVGFCNGDANSVIRLLEVTNQGVTIEQIDRYNVLSAVFSDFVSQNKSANLLSILQGGCDTGKSFVSVSSGGYYRVAVPIYSAFYGVLASNYAPATDGIRIRLTLEAPHTALISPTASVSNLAYTISNLNLMMEYVSVEPAVWEELASASGRVFKTHGIGVANFNSTLTAQSTSNNVLIPCRKSAVKHIWNTLRPSANLNAIAKNSTGSRLFPNARQLYYTIAGKQYPQIPIRCSNDSGTAFAGAEAMAELLKTMRNLHGSTTDCCFDSVDYVDNVGAVEESAFVWGYDWESDADPKTISGIDTNSSNIYLQLDSATGSVGLPTASIGVPVASVLDSFVFYDAILTTSVDDGRVSVIQ